MFSEDSSSDEDTSSEDEENISYSERIRIRWCVDINNLFAEEKMSEEKLCEEIYFTFFSRPNSKDPELIKHTICKIVQEKTKNLTR